MNNSEENALIGDKKELLEQIEAYKITSDDSIASSILEKYYAPHRAELEERMRNNLITLKDYPYCYADAEKLPETLPLWFDDHEVIYFQPLEKRFHKIQRLAINQDALERNTVIAVAANFWLDDLAEYERRTALMDERRFNGIDIPMYLIYTPEEWKLFLQIVDITPLLTFKRIVFLVGEKSIKYYFCDDGVIFPKDIYGMLHTSEYGVMIRDIMRDKEKQLAEYIKEINNYYSANKAEIDRHFIEGKPRILVLTTLFSTALQYNARDLMLAAQNCGCDSKLLIEQDYLHRVDNVFNAKVIAEFKPDALLMLDHFRYEQDQALYPESLIFITWVQDFMPNIFNPNVPSKLHKRDFIMNALVTFNTFFAIGFDREQIIEAPVPSNHHIYRPYELSEAEKEKYGADICILCHWADVERCMRDETNKFSHDPDAQAIIIDLYRNYYKLARNKEIIYHSEKEFWAYIERYLQEKYHMRLDRESRAVMADVVNHMRVFYIYTVFHRLLADWLIDAGFKNIKLWGNEWVKFEQYKNYAMGPAQNGEVLSKIYQASKIVLGTNPSITAASRTWESMLSGAFYMANYVPPDVDRIDIRKIMTVGENLVMFYNRKDLIKKVRYYLKHEDERLEMARRGREVALSKMTYDALMKRVIDFIGNKLAERSKQ